MLGIPKLSRVLSGSFEIPLSLAFLSHCLRTYGTMATQAPARELTKRTVVSSFIFKGEGDQTRVALFRRSDKVRTYQYVPLHMSNTRLPYRHIGACVACDMILRASCGSAWDFFVLFLKLRA